MVVPIDKGESRQKGDHKMKYEIGVKTIGGKDYDYVCCPRCGVWIQTKDFNFETGEHEGCDRYRKNKGIRERAAERALNGRRN